MSLVSWFRQLAQTSRAMFDDPPDDRYEEQFAARLTLTELEERRVLNVAPVAVADNYTIAEGGILDADDADGTDDLNPNNNGVLANDTDSDGDPLTAVKDTDPLHGTLTLNSDGTFIYTHDGSENFSDSFTYHANDGTDDSAIVTVNITITQVNDPPVITAPPTETTDEDTAVTFSTGNSNAISIADNDAGSDDVEVTLTSTNGTSTLSQTTGLTFSDGDGTDDDTMTFTGSLTDVNAALEGLEFDPDQDFNGAASLQIDVDDQGNNGGAAETDSETVAITVNADNDPPEITAPANEAVNKNKTLTFSTADSNAISISDVDAGSGEVEVTLTATDGTMSLSQTTGLTFSDGDGTDDTTMTFTGTLSDVNAALDGLTYDPNINFTGPATLQIDVDDQGNSGGAAETDTATVSINVVSVNDPPEITAPATDSTDEDTALTFSTGTGNAISIFDIDAGAGEVEVTLTATNGTITLAQTTGLTFSDGDGTDDDTMTFTGTLTDVNAALEGLVYDPDQDFNGAATLQIDVDDQGNTGGGTNRTDSETVAITVNATNDPPVITAPATDSTSEDTTLTFSSGGGNAISISDVDAGSGEVEVTLTATNGTVTLAQTTGLTFTDGDGTDDATMTFTGTLTDVNAALEGLDFDPTTDFTGAASLQIDVDDQGNSGGAAETDTETVAITINSDNDPPVITAPANESTDEDVDLTFSTGNGNAISISDVDAGSGEVEVTLTATDGTLTLAQTTGLTFSDGDGSDDTTMTFTGTLTDVNAALDGLTYAPDQDFNGAATLQIDVDDQGNTGGAAETDTETVNITVDAVNDPPDITAPATATTDEDVDITFSTGNSNAISISDVDADTDDIEVTLTATNGTVSLSQTTGLTFSDGDGTDDVTMTFTGTVAEVNAALEGLTFAPDQDFNGAASLQIDVDDQGNNGSGGNMTDSETVAITVDPVNDPPVISAPANESTDEDVNLTFSTGNGNAISISDVDAASGEVQVTLTATDGTVSLSQTTGLTFTDGDGTDDATMTFTGTLSDVNAALEGLVYDPDQNFNGAATLQIDVDDQSNSGGPAETDSETVNITVDSVNDPPVITAPAADSTDEDTTLTFSTGNSNAISISDSDVAGDEVEVTLTATNGTVSLSQTTGLTFSDGDGTDDATMTFTGTLADVNAALEGLTFDPDQDFNGAASLQIDVDDQGNNGGPAETDTETVAITVNAVNDPPVITAPAADTTNEDIPLTFSTGGSNSISISDVDAAGDDVSVTLTATNGTMSLSQTTGLAFSDGDGTDDVTMTFTGSLADVNAALEGLTFTPDQDFNGAASVQIDVDDQGNNGSGTNLTDTETVAITVNSVNDPPVIAAPAGDSVDEDATLTFSTGNGNAISISDADVGGGEVEVTLTATDGTVSLSQTTGLTFSDGDGTDDATMTFTGSVADINAALEGLTYSPDADFNGAATLQVDVDDQGNSGGAAETDSETIAITVNPVNDAPVITAPTTDSIAEDNTLTFSTANGNAISVSDVDVAGDEVQVTLSATDGTMSLSQTTGLTFTDGDGTDDATMTFTGSLSDVNAALDGLSYTPNLNFNGPATLTIDVDDQGNNGSGGNLADNSIVAITVGPVNDAPIALPATYTVDEGGQIIADDFEGMNDADPNNDGVMKGDIDVDTPKTAMNASVVDQPDHGTVTMNSDGTFTYTHDGSENFTDSFTYVLNDGEIDSNVATVTINITPVNDNAPVATGETYTVTEGGTLTADDQAGGDGDANNDALLLNDTDSDLPGDVLSVNVTDQPDHGTLTMDDATGTFTYVHDDSENFTDTFTYEVFDGVNNSTTVTVTINIEPTNDNTPTVTNVTVDPAVIDENGTVTITGSFDDIDQFDSVGVEESHTVMIDWGDGTAPTAATVDQANDTFTATHQYLDDGTVDGDGDPVFNTTVSVTVTDAAAASVNGDPADVTVNNVPPTLTVPPTVTVAADGTVVITGSVDDVGSVDTLDLSVEWGDGTPVGSPTVDATTGEFTIDHQYIGNPDPNNPTASIPIIVTLTDDDGGVTVIVMSGEVPSAGLFGIVLNTEPERDDDILPVFQADAVPNSETTVPTVGQSNAAQSGGADVASNTGRRFVLRVVTPDGSEGDDIELVENILERLKLLFGRLPDDHYRIYLIREDGSERMVLDFYVRQGRPVDPSDEDEKVTGDNSESNIEIDEADAESPPGENQEKPEVNNSKIPVEDEKISLGPALIGPQADNSQFRYSAAKRHAASIAALATTTAAVGVQSVWAERVDDAMNKFDSGMRNPFLRRVRKITGQSRERDRT